MATTRKIVDGLWQINLGPVNAFLLDAGELTLIDTGLPENAAKITAAIESLGKKTTDLKHIIVTHCHPDHAGGLAAIRRASQARVYMHATDAAMVRVGNGKRPLTAAPGLIRHILFRLFVAGRSGAIEPCSIDCEVADGAELPIAGGLRAIHAPGHCAGQLVFLWPRRGVLFAADAASNMPRLGLSLGYEDLELGLRSLAKLAALDFEIACFGHGAPITTNASARFRSRWHRVEP
jgi:glyoxylase-like metal-dependent hydrolase (beta-lactamase superfamily II)